MSQHCRANPCCGNVPCTGVPTPQHASGLPWHNRAKNEIRINVTFVRYRLNRNKVSAICVHDGRTEKSQWTGRPVPLETWIPMKFVNWPFDRFTVKAREQLQIDIPLSFAEESGLIHARDMQHN